VSTALNEDGSAGAALHERVRNPLLTDISVDWGGLAVSDTYPQRIPDLFGAAGHRHRTLRCRGRA
jgi:Ca-activated chloride channel family protein